MKTATAKRILKLELGAGVIETAASRRMREAAQAILRSRAARRASEGLPPEKLDEPPREDLSGLTVAQCIRRARARRLEREQASQRSEQDSDNRRGSASRH